MKALINKKFLAGAVSLFLLFVFILPLTIFADDFGPQTEANSGLVRCGNTITVTGDKITGDCKFEDFVALINRIIDWIISIAGVIFTISTIYGGFLYMTSGENPGNKEQAKKILTGTLLGFVIILCAWLIVYTLLRYLVGDSSDVLLFLK
jgi:hypothetical protein